MKKTFTKLSVVLISISSFAQISNEGLIAHFPFNQNLVASNNSQIVGSSNGTITYTEKNGFALAISNSPESQQCNGSWITSCFMGGCSDFCQGSLIINPKTNNHVSLPLGEAPLTNAFTIAFWLSSGDNLDAWNTYFSKRLEKSFPRVLYNTISIARTNSGDLYAGLTTDTDIEVNTIATNFPSNTWKHVAFVYDGNQAKLYVDGTLIDTKVASGNLLYNQSNGWILGQLTQSDNSQSGNFSMDDLFIFNKAIEADDIFKLKEEGVTRLFSSVYENRNLISPNPAKDFVNIDSYAEIFNLVGEKVAEGEGKISVSHLNSGVYVVKMGKNTQKLIKNKPVP
ncbi:MAG: LamG-like jellyroll fold domain-containing protein [Cytophagales bacterium]